MIKCFRYLLKNCFCIFGFYSIIMFEIRAATPSDIKSITEIYNDAVLNTTATFDHDIQTEEERMQWLIHRKSMHPVIVGLINNEVAGWAALSPWNPKKGYDIIAEVSVYVHPEFQFQGLGSKLLHEIIIQGSKVGLHSLLSRITTDNIHSIHLHEKEGFVKTGVLHEAGQKFNRYLDVMIMQKMLNP
jgi:L-amino acid N-acyltransferase YncA